MWIVGVALIVLNSSSPLVYQPASSKFKTLPECIEAAKVIKEQAKAKAVNADVQCFPVE